MNVLAIGCHPDDIEINCAGTLAKCAQRGDKVTICHVANGNLGHVIIEPDELRDIRAAEAKKSGAMIGAEVISCDIGDLVVEQASKMQKDLIVDVLRTVQPDVILTHAPSDYMPDHLAVSRLVFDASFAASVPHYKTAVPGAAELTPIYYMDNLAGINFIPTEYVDVSDVIETKLNMLECHESQLKWMREHDNIDFAEFVRSCARARGLQCGVQYAEGFTQCLAWGKIKPMRMLP